MPQKHLHEHFMEENHQGLEKDVEITLIDKTDPSGLRNARISGSVHYELWLPRVLIWRSFNDSFNYFYITVY